MEKSKAGLFWGCNSQHGGHREGLVEKVTAERECEGGEGGTTAYSAGEGSKWKEQEVGRVWLEVCKKCDSELTGARAGGDVTSAPLHSCLTLSERGVIGRFGAER